jgi:hypothetical protein
MPWCWPFDRRCPELVEGLRAQTMTGPPSPIPPAVLLRFTSAESRLYPMAMTDPDGYERAITLVGMVASGLRQQCTDLDSVLERRNELIAALPELAAEKGLELGGLPPDAVVDAASALRCRELQARA